MHIILSCVVGTSISWDVFDVFKSSGCSMECPSDVHHLSPVELLSYHYYFAQLPKSAKLQWIVDYIHTHSSTTNPNITFIISGKPVCQALWIATLGISKSFFYKARRKVSTGCIHIYKELHRTPLQKSNRAVAWMHNYFTLIGDLLPNRMVVHLPSNLSKSSVYNRMRMDMLNRSCQYVSKSQFFRLWEETFPHVTIPKVC